MRERLTTYTNHIPIALFAHSLHDIVLLLGSLQVFILPLPLTPPPLRVALFRRIFICTTHLSALSTLSTLSTLPTCVSFGQRVLPNLI